MSIVAGPQMRRIPVHDAMLSGKFDINFYRNLEKQYNEADCERRRISRAADAASNAPV